MSASADIPPNASATGWVNPHPKDDPRSLLLEYQWRFWNDPARFKAGLWSRQTGKDFTESGEAVEDCFRRPKTRWMIVAPSERQSMLTLEKAREWLEAFDLKVHDYSEVRDGSTGEHLLRAADATLSNGSKIRAVPGKPDTVRGESSNVILTEFDFFEQPAETWRAILPSITNPLRGGEKKVRIITTPNGLGGAMHKIWTKPDGRFAWSKHKVTIHDAVRMGLPVDVEELREMMDDPEGWAQEFECEFLDTVSVLLGYDLLAACETPLATTLQAPDYWAADPGVPRVLGIDFGRKKDLTVCWASEVLAENYTLTKEVLCLQGMSTPRQVEELSPRIAGSKRVCLDYTGPGVGLGDYLVEKFGEWKPEAHKFGKIELCTFTNALKVELFSKLRMRFEGRRTGTPVDRTIREDLHSVQRVALAGGGITYRAPHTKDGHADRATAAALNGRAAESLLSVSDGAFTAEQALRSLTPAPDFSWGDTPFLPS